MNVKDNNRINPPDLSGICKLIGAAIVVYCLFRARLSFILGVILMIPIYLFWVKVHGVNGALKRTIIIGSLPITLSILLFLISLKQMISSGEIGTEPNLQFEFVRQLLLAPLLPAGLLMIARKDTPLEKRVYGWNEIPDDPAPSNDGVHSYDKAVIGFRYDGPRIIPVYLPFKPGGHAFILGRTGSSKSATVSNAIEAHCEERDGNGNRKFVLVVDGKSDYGEYSLYQLMKREARRTGRKLYVIDIANPSEMINPFSGMSATSVRDALLATTEYSDDYYKYNASNFYGVLIDSLMRSEDEVITFKTLERFCDGKRLKALVHHLFKEGKIEEWRKDDYLSVIDATSEIARSSAPRFATLAQGEGEFLFPKNAEECEKALDLVKAYREDSMVLIMINSLAYQEYSFATGSLVLSSLKQLLSRIQSGKEEKKGIFCVLDEMSQYSSAEVVDQIFSQGRVAGLQVVGLAQSFTDFNKRPNGDFLKNKIVGNCSYFINFILPLSEDAEEIAGIYATRQAPEVTAKLEGEKKSPEGSLRIVQEFKVHPSVIKDLPPHVGYIKYAGEIEPGPYRFTCRLVDFNE